MKKRVCLGFVCAVLCISGLGAQQLVVREDGRIAGSNVRLGQESTVSWHAVEVEYPAILSVHLVSVDFTPRLLIERDGEVQEADYSETGSIVHSFPVSPDQTLRIGVATSVVSESGHYSLRVESSSAATPLQTATPITGRLGSNHAGQSTPVLYTYQGTAGEVIRIRQESTEFDTYLRISDNTGQIAYNDDADATTTDSEIIHYFREPGWIFIEADSFGSFGTGRFTIAVHSLDLDTDYTPGRRLQPGDEIMGFLAPSDLQIAGRRAQEFSIEVTSGTEIDLLMRSNAFDAYLIAEAPSGRRYEDDDSGGGLDAHLIMSAEESGIWRVYAAAWGLQSGGNYTLRYRENPPMSIVAEFTGSLLPSGRVYEHRTFQEHPVQTEAGRRYRVELVSDDFDTYLVVLDSSGQLVALNDDFGGSTNSRVEFEGDGSEYLILAGAFYGVPAGIYRIEVRH
ncbi:hypothetical protein [Spirochaeta africana]|uniref:Peptidase C-terminal archaeal/bacterial domain-containing protein n=1 Tax=Spirochaeta africana (strain ATCC 700263 / DSM 8902 / Z-7692) TaxID=889378 RepID=H9ULQ1_SPIAZ|nr:hypothetical protein [Spirochaeta africana]AFG38444.1 hypothetical protein Spiaf_2413 [Spirochaeta africana DSM 8902]